MTSNNKRIAKNTAMLYFRMLITMAVTLYASRIILNTLGVEDFGIYNVVGGFITMLGFLNNAMSSATQRFLTFEIGKKDIKQLKNVFSMSVNIHIIIALIVFIIAETVGLWFVNNQLNIPTDRILAAKWVYHFSILTLIVNMISVPYNAMIIANEKMCVFAWISIIEVSLKLAIVFILKLSEIDKLKLYAILVFSVSLIIRLIYGIYCNKKFKDSTYKLYWNKSLFKTLIHYASWNLWGNVAGVIMDQGVNILLNIFFGPLVNAARAIAFQVKSAISQFVTNFQIAMNPQIIKTFAADDLKSMHELIYKGSKYSFFLLLILAMPLLKETENILKLWLKIVPEYSVIFTRLVIINILIDCISGPLMTAAQASGKIRLYQSVVGGLLILNLPISYIFLHHNFEPQITLYISISVSLVALYLRLKIISPLVNLNIRDYFLKVITKIIIVSSISLVTFLPMININNVIMQITITFIITTIILLIIIFTTGLEREEQIFFIQKTKKIIQ